MAQTITIGNATYSNVPSVSLPKSGGGYASFMDTSDANAVASDLAQNKVAYANGVKLVGTASGGGVTTASKTATLSRSTTATISGLSGNPQFFALYFSGSSMTTNNTYYYITSVVYDGTNVNVECSRSSGNKSGNAYHNTNATKSYSNGTLTITTSSSSDGQFYAGNYVLFYGY